MPILDATPTKLATRKVEGQTDAAIGNHPLRRATDIGGMQPAYEMPARYQVLDEIGMGGMGIVYKVYDRDTGEVIALKILKPEVAADETMRENLRQEVCLARKVTHKNVCRIHEFNRSAGAACISMELVEGESLAAKLHSQGALPAITAIDIARQICAGLREAHAQGIVHRDLKPSNIMVSSTGLVKIMDFGIARLSQSATQMTRTLIGTPEYMAPEQVELKGVTPRTDIYSLGLVLYEIVTGVRAFSGDSAIAVAVQQIRRMPKGPAEIHPAIDIRLDRVIMKCLSKEPAKRYQSVDELDAALAQWQHADATAVSGVETTQKLKRVKAELQPIVDRGFEVARAAASKAGSLALQAGAIIDQKARRATGEFSRIAGPAIGKSMAHLRSRESIAPAWLTASRIRSAQVASIVGVTFLTTAVTFGLVTGKGSHAKYATMAAAAVPALHMAPPDFAIPPAITGTTLAFAPDDESSQASANTPAPVSGVPESQEKSAKGVTLPRGSPSTTRSKKSKSRTQPVTASLPNSAAVASLPLAPVSIYVNTPALTAQPVPADPMPVKPDALAAPKPTVAVSYLDVASFKDARWADTAVDQLTKLGFQALSVHKGKLFLQSYHVEVGPYDNAADIQAAVARLAAQGFTAHAVK